MIAMTMINAGFIRTLFGPWMETATWSPVDQSSSRVRRVGAGYRARTSDKTTVPSEPLGDRQARVGQPDDAPLWIDPDPSVSQIDQRRRHPTHEVPLGREVAAGIPDEGHPGIPGRRVVDVEEALRLELGSSVREVVVRQVHKESTAIAFACWARPETEPSFPSGSNVSDRRRSLNF